MVVKTEVIYENGIWKGKAAKHSEGHWKYGEKILQQLRSNPQTIGQIDAKTGKEDTFERIADRSIRCALWLKEQGIKRGDVIALCTHNQLDTAVPFFASLFLGAVCNPWWEMYLDEEMVKYFIELAEPKVIFVHEESAAFVQKMVNKVRPDIKVIVLGEVSGIQSLQEILGKQNSEEVQSFECEKIESSDHPAVLIYTSGTTGKPKATLLSCGGFTAGVGNDVSDDVVDSRGFWCSSMCWISAVIGNIFCVMKKATGIIYPNPSEADICRLIEQYKINWIIIGTGAANRLQHTPEASTYNMSSVELLLFGGAIPSDGLEKFLIKTFLNADIYQLYGATELFGSVIQSKISENSKPCTCGKPTNNVDIKVIDPASGKILGPNEEGEICIKSPYIMKGYLKNPEATARVVDAEGWYHTDDLGYYDKDGDFFVIDRLKELIKCKLYDIAPGPIENCILQHPSVAEAAVVAKPYGLDREQPMAFVTKLPGADVTEEEIMDLVVTKLTDKMKLSGGVKFLNKMPYTASGKIAKKNLRNMARLLTQQ